MFFFDDQITNIRDVQSAFPRSTCVLIDPRPVERDVREFEGNPYFQKMPMNRGFNKEHMVGLSLYWIGIKQYLLWKAYKCHGVTIPLKM